MNKTLIIVFTFFAFSGLALAQETNDVPESAILCLIEPTEEVTRDQGSVHSLNVTISCDGSQEVNLFKKSFSYHVKGQGYGKPNIVTGEKRTKNQVLTHAVSILVQQGFKLLSCSNAGAGGLGGAKVTNSFKEWQSTCYLQKNVN